MLSHITTIYGIIIYIYDKIIIMYILLVVGGLVLVGVFFMINFTVNSPNCHK